MIGKSSCSSVVLVALDDLRVLVDRQPGVGVALDEEGGLLLLGLLLHRDVLGGQAADQVVVLPVRLEEVVARLLEVELAESEEEVGGLLLVGGELDDLPQRLDLIAALV